MSDKKSLVVKDNRLVEASYRLELSEQRLILIAIVQARKNTPTTADSVLQVTAKDFAKTCGLDERSGYNRLKEAADSLFHKWVKIRSIHATTGKNAITTTRWVSSCTYVEQAGLVELQLAPKIIPYITDLESKFTSYQLKNVAQMTSTYAIRLYELLAQYKTVGARYFQIQRLKEFLGADEKSYERMDNFKRNVMKIAVDQINALTDLTISYVDRKAGRRVIGFEFWVEQQPIDETQQASQTTKADQAKRSLSKKSNQASVASKVKIGLSLSEKSMLKQLCEQTGRAESELLAQARAAADGEVFLWLDAQLRAINTA